IVQIAALPNFNADYIFSHWESDCGNIDFDDTISTHTSFTMPAHDIAIRAIFVRMASYTISVLTQNSWEIAQPNRDTASPGERVYLFAASDIWSDFERWMPIYPLNLEIHNPKSYTNAFFYMPDTHVRVFAAFREGDFMNIGERFITPTGGRYTWRIESCNNPIGWGFIPLANNFLTIYDSQNYRINPTSYSRINEFIIDFTFDLPPGQYTLIGRGAGTFGNVRIRFWEGGQMPESPFFVRAVFPDGWDARMTFSGVRSDTSIGGIWWRPGDRVYLGNPGIPHNAPSGAAGYVFAGWEAVYGNVDIQHTTYQGESQSVIYFIMPAEDVIVRPRFIQGSTIMEGITIIGDNSDMDMRGRVDATGLLDLETGGRTIALMATPAPRFQFERWEIVSGELSGIVSLYSPIITFSPLQPHQEPVVIRPIFVPSPGTHEVGVISSNPEWGRPTFAGSVVNEGVRFPGEIVTLRPGSYFGFLFNYWEILQGNVDIQFNHDTSGGRLWGYYFIMPDTPVQIRAVYAPRSIITVFDIPNPIAGLPFSFQFDIARTYDPMPRHAWFASPSPFPGMSISPTGLLSGTPPFAGRLQGDVHVENWHSRPLWNLAVVRNPAQPVVTIVQHNALISGAVGEYAELMILVSNMPPGQIFGINEIDYAQGASIAVDAPPWLEASGYIYIQPDGTGSGILRLEVIAPVLHVFEFAGTRFVPVN
ncbi:MAG: hypothetical protein FWB71_06615, partial [Defluviitaleaceae bacterium]|nr:hypothetical protein [Defluviitaleaceae bacterium]